MHLVSDFDGVWTDPRPEADAIRDLMAEKLAQASSLALETVKQTFQEIEQEFTYDPFNYGWLFDGQITAFACEDMYGRNHAIASALWNSKPEVSNGAILKEAISSVAGSPEALADLCFREGRERYRESNRAFLVKEASEVVSKIVAMGHRMTIVSNSKIDHIVDLFEAAGIDTEAFDVIGGARKFHLGVVEELPQYLMIDNAAISLHRPHYYKLLKELKPDCVIGDVISLDIALPFYLKTSEKDWQSFRAGLIKQSYTPSWAETFCATSTETSVNLLGSLAVVPEWLNNITQSR